MPTGVSFASAEGSSRSQRASSHSASSTGMATPEEDEPDMKWACEITAMRLLKTAKKEHLIPLLEDFGVPTKGSKEELSTLLSEQLHYETDSGDDE